MKKAPPRIRRHFSVIGHSDDVVEVRHGVWNPVSHTLRDDSGSGSLFRIVGLFRLSHFDLLDEVLFLLYDFDIFNILQHSAHYAHQVSPPQRTR